MLRRVATHRWPSKDVPHTDFAGAEAADAMTLLRAESRWRFCTFWRPSRGPRRWRWHIPRGAAGVSPVQAEIKVAHALGRGIMIPGACDYVGERTC